jgi:hypothetical protein
VDAGDAGQRGNRERPKWIAAREDDVASSDSRYRKGQQVVICGPCHYDTAAQYQAGCDRNQRLLKGADPTGGRGLGDDSADEVGEEAMRCVDGHRRGEKSRQPLGHPFWAHFQSRPVDVYPPHAQNPSGSRQCIRQRLLDFDSSNDTHYFDHGREVLPPTDSGRGDTEGTRKIGCDQHVGRPDWAKAEYRDSWKKGSTS